MGAKNFMELKFAARSENEAFARVTVASFVSHLDLMVEELEEIKTVVSEAVTNSIIHGYENQPDGIVYISTSIDDQTIEIIVEDQGKGIENIEEARQPLYTSKPELERSGMGFTIMENFMDQVEITSGKGKGTRLRLLKHLSSNQAICN